jgi:hypothetical protein
MNQIRSSSDDFAAAFESAFARLQVLLEEACAAQAQWPAKVAAAIDAGLRFAASDPAAAQLLTNDALAHGVDGVTRHERLIFYIREALVPGRELRPANERLPEITEQAMASGIVMLVAQRVDRGMEAELPAIAGEAIQFVLTPYLGSEEARQIGAKQWHTDRGPRATRRRRRLAAGSGRSSSRPRR